MKTCFMIRLHTIASAVADLVYCDDLDAYLITRINVPKLYRGRGIGTQLLKLILNEADDEGVILVLEIQASDGLSHAELRLWYMRHGFKLRGKPSRYQSRLYVRYPQGDEHDLSPSETKTAIGRAAKRTRQSRRSLAAVKKPAARGVRVQDDQSGKKDAR